MSPAPRDRAPTGDDEVVFRTLAAPGLEEDDLFRAMAGGAGAGSVWGDGVPATFAPPEPDADDAAERRRRHEELLRRWPPELAFDGPDVTRGGGAAPG